MQLCWLNIVEWIIVWTKQKTRRKQVNVDSSYQRHLWMLFSRLKSKVDYLSQVALFKAEVQSLWNHKLVSPQPRCRNKVQAQSWLSMKPQPRCRNKVWCSVFQIFASSVLQSVSMSLTNQLILSVLQTIILKTGIKLQCNCKFYRDITGVHFSCDNIARLITSAMV